MESISHWLGVCNKESAEMHCFHCMIPYEIINNIAQASKISLNQRYLFEKRANNSLNHFFLLRKMKLQGAHSKLTCVHDYLNGRAVETIVTHCSSPIKYVHMSEEGANDE